MSITPQSQILTSLENGINLDLFLEATGIDKETFLDKVYANELNADEWKSVKAIIKDWERFV